MTRKELFFSLLEEDLQEDGYVYKKYKNQFVKKNGKDQFVIGFQIWPHFYQLEPNYEIFLYEIEKVKKAAWGKNYERLWTMSTTRLYLTKYLGINKEIEHTLITETEEQAEEAAVREMCFYLDIVKPYFFTKYSDIKFLDEYLNSEPKRNQNHLNLSLVRNSCMSVIAAYLNKNSHLPDLINTFRNFMKENKGIHETSIAEYESLARYLLEN